MGMNKLVINFAFLFALLAPGAVAAAEGAAAPGLIAHYYSGVDFGYYGGATAVPGNPVNLEINRLKWPVNNTDPAKGPVFYRHDGWSIACRGALELPTAGDYAFRVESVAAELRVAGALAPADGADGMTLKSGKTPIVLYLKFQQDGGSREWARAALQWKIPGAQEFQTVPAEALSHSKADAAETLTWRPDILLDKWEDRLSQREQEFEIKEEGLYEIAAGLTRVGAPSRLRLRLNGKTVSWLQTREWLATYKKIVPPGANAEYGIDFLNRFTVLRPLKPGKHTLAVYRTNGWPWNQGKEMDSLIGEMRIGLTQIRDHDSGSVGFRVVDGAGADREDIVFEKGEPLNVQVLKADGAGEFAVEVREQRGGKEALWSGRGVLARTGRYLSALISYPNNREGAFEYVVKDAFGRIVSGPWAFVTVDPTPLPEAKGGPTGGEIKKVLVDSVDCTLPEDPVHKFRDSGNSKVVESPLGTYRVTGNAGPRKVIWEKDAGSGVWRPEETPGTTKARWDNTSIALDWFGYTLRVSKPGTPHLLVATIPNDLHRLTYVQALDPVTTRETHGVLETMPAAGGFGKLAIMVWPNGGSLDVLTACHGGGIPTTNSQEGAIAKFELFELPEGLPGMPSPAGGWAEQCEFGSDCEQWPPWIFESAMPSMWEGDDPLPGHLPCRHQRIGYRDWRALLTAAERFGAIARYRGENCTMVPVLTYAASMMQNIHHLPGGMDIAADGYRTRLVDPFERDIFKLLLLSASKHGQRLVADLMVQRLAVIGEGGIVEQFARNLGCQSLDGLFVTDGNGQRLGGKDWPQLNPAHPAARKYVAAVLGDIGKQYGKYPAFAGVRIRHWRQWRSQLDPGFYSDEDGYDDFTVGLFEKETGATVTVSGPAENRFALRRERLMKTDGLRDQWLDWRCQKTELLLEEGLAELRRHAPQARLYSGAATLSGAPGDRRDKRVTPAFFRGGGLDPARLAGQRDLGFEVWRKYGDIAVDGAHCIETGGVYLPGFDAREPASVRGTAETFAPGEGSVNRYPGGLYAQYSLRAHPYQLEEPARDLAAGKLDRIVCGEQWGISPLDEGLRNFARVFRAIPGLKYERFSGKGSDQSAVTCWSAGQDGKLIAYLVNLTPQARQVELAFSGKPAEARDPVTGDKLRRGGNGFTLRLDPFMPGLVEAAGVDRIEALTVAVVEEDMRRVGERVEFLKKIGSLAGDQRHIFLAGGERYAVGEAGNWGRRDVTESFGDCFGPIAAAWQEKNYLRADMLIRRLSEEREWWLEAYGWFPGVYAPRFRRTDGPVEWVKDGLKAEGESSIARKLREFRNADFVMVPSGRATWRIRVDPVPCELRVWGLFGGGYGPVRVERGGKVIGKLGELSGNETRHVHHALPIVQNGPDFEVKLIDEGGKGLAVSWLQVTPLPRAVIREWSVCGLFQTTLKDQWIPDLDREFKPEKSIELEAAYDGYAGKKAGWRRIDIGEDKFVQLLEKYFPYDHNRKDGVAYLVTWVHSPAKRSTRLHYSLDWFGRVWVNDQKVLEIAGPWGSFAHQPIELNPGWNKLLVKTVAGSAGWKAAFALDDSGDLKYSATTPEGK